MNDMNNMVARINGFTSRISSATCAYRAARGCAHIAYNYGVRTQARMFWNAVADACYRRAADLFEADREKASRSAGSLSWDPS